ncbi:MAG: MBG-2 domain-containing protein, partial [Eggerthellaceae bacterium]|nr:MBG-2 domain-containing protein [Eggerthellaceae bacterium]
MFLKKVDKFLSCFLALVLVLGLNQGLGISKAYASPEDATTEAEKTFQADPLVESNGTGSTDDPMNLDATINKVDIGTSDQITVSGVTAKEYQASRIEQQPTIMFGDITLSEGTDYELEFGDNYNVGTGAGTITIKPLSDIFTGQKTLSFDITKATLQIAIADQNCKVDEFAPNLDVLVDAGTAYAVTGWKGDDATKGLLTVPTLKYNPAPASPCIAAGEYAIEINAPVSAGNNYMVQVTNGTLTVGKAKSSCTPPTALDLTFNGADQILTTDVVDIKGKGVKYRLEGMQTWSETKPQARNAGSYVVEYYVVGNDNYYDSDVGKVSVTIKKLDISTSEQIIVSGVTSMEYNAMQLTQKPSVSLGEQSLAEGTDFTFAYGENYLAGKDAGKIQIIGNEDSNYTGTKTVSFEITKAPLIVKIADQKGMVGEVPPAFTADSYSVSGWKGSDATAGIFIAPTLQYDPGISGTIQHSGNYTIKSIEQPTVNSSNYTINVENGTLFAAKGTPTLTRPRALTPTYTGFYQPLIDHIGSSTGGKVVYSLDGTNWTNDLSTLTGKDAGDYTIFYKSEANDDYDESTLGTITVTIDKADISTFPSEAFGEIADHVYCKNPYLPKPTVTYQGQKLVEGTDFIYSYGENVHVVPTEGKSNTVTIVAVERGNFKGSKTLPVAITPKPLTVTVSNKTGEVENYPPTDMLTRPIEGTDYSVEGFCDGDTFKGVVLLKYDNSDPAFLDGPLKTAGEEWPIILCDKIEGSINCPGSDYAVTVVPGKLTV